MFYDQWMINELGVPAIELRVTNSKGKLQVKIINVI